MWLISAAALLAAGFAVSAAMATAILERRGEIGLMRSLGASKGAIAFLFYTETGLLAILAGSLGYLAGSGLAAWLGARIFRGDGGAPEAVLIPVLLPVVVALALVVAIAGSTPSIRSRAPHGTLRHPARGRLMADTQLHRHAAPVAGASPRPQPVRSHRDDGLGRRRDGAPDALRRPRHQTAQRVPQLRRKHRDHSPGKRFAAA